MSNAEVRAVSLTAATILLSMTSAFGTEPNVVEIGMSNGPDGSQFMMLSRGSVHSGPVVFRVANRSTNTVHEFLIVRTDLDPNAFPMRQDDPNVDETKLKGIKELGELKPGESGEMRMTLDPGRYVMFCNQPGHFHAGMFAILAVQPQQS